jgi:hypothetical protein
MIGVANYGSFDFNQHLAEFRAFKVHGFNVNVSPDFRQRQLFVFMLGYSTGQVERGCLTINQP